MVPFANWTLCLVTCKQFFRLNQDNPDVKVTRLDTKVEKDQLNIRKGQQKPPKGEDKRPTKSHNHIDPKLSSGKQRDMKRHGDDDRMQE